MIRAIHSIVIEPTNLLALNSVNATFYVTLGLGGLDLSLSLRVFLLAGCLPVCGSGDVADGLDCCPFHGVELSGHLRDVRSRSRRPTRKVRTLEGSEDIMR